MTSTPADDRAERFSELFREFTPSVRGFVRTMVAASDVEPVVQATFETAWTKMEAIPLLSQRAWLFGVARNHVRNHVRAERRRSSLVDAIGALRPVEETRLFPGGVDPVEVAPLLAALQRLSCDERELVQLVAWHEMEPAEIAVVLDISANNARVRIHRARRHLETLMQAELGEEDR
jgi:RNA polymerase sigma-70 factor (ECF subfamily)